MSRSARLSASGLPWLRVLAGLSSCVTFLFLALSAVRAGSEGESPAPDRFLREYRDAMRNLQSLYADVTVTGEYRILPRAKSTNFTYASSGKKEKMHLWREKPNYFDRAFVSADNRKFTVSRLTQAGSYYLESISGSDEVWPPSLMDYKLRSQGVAYCPAGMGKFPGFVNSPEFSVTRVSRVSEGGTALLNVDFEIEPSRKDAINKIKGWIRVDPQQAFVIRSYDFELRRAITKGKKAGEELVFLNQGRVAYKWENGKPVPTETHATLSLNGKVVSEDILTFSTFSFESAPAADFTFAAFGLDDVERTARQIESVG